MTSKRALEGQLLIDHRASPGVTPEDIATSGLDLRTLPLVSRGQVYESATISCTHCQAVVVLNPLRTRSRNYCWHCDHYICDNPICVQMAAGMLPHRPMRQVFDQVQEAAARAMADPENPELREMEEIWPYDR